MLKYHCYRFTQIINALKIKVHRHNNFYNLAIILENSSKQKTKNNER